MLDVFRTLHTVLGDIDGADAVREAVVFAAWRRIAGEAIVEPAVALKLQNGTLSVAVSSITWQRHLKDLCGQIVFKINAALGVPTVTFIDLRIDERAVLENREKRSNVRYTDPEAAVNEITPDLARAADSIADD